MLSVWLGGVWRVSERCCSLGRSDLHWPSSRCIAAVLTSNMDLTLWGAAKNAIHGEWLKVRLHGFCGVD